MARAGRRETIRPSEVAHPLVPLNGHYYLGSDALPPTPARARGSQSRPSWLASQPGRDQGHGGFLQNLMVSEGARRLGKPLWNQRSRTSLYGNLLAGGWHDRLALMPRTPVPTPARICVAILLEEIRIGAARRIDAGANVIPGAACP